MNTLSAANRIGSGLRHVFIALSLILIAGSCVALSGFSAQVAKTSDARAGVKAFVGTWEAQFNGKPFFTLKLRVLDGKLTGTCIHAVHMNWDDKGNLSDVDQVTAEDKIVSATITGHKATLKIADGDDANDALPFELTLDGSTSDKADGRMTLPPNLPKSQPWKFKRVSTAP